MEARPLPFHALSQNEDALQGAVSALFAARNSLVSKAQCLQRPYPHPTFPMHSLT